MQRCCDNYFNQYEKNPKLKILFLRLAIKGLERNYHLTDLDSPLSQNPS